MKTSRLFLAGATLAMIAAGCELDPLYGTPDELQLFPSDTVTVADGAQLTGRRVNLDKPTCDDFLSDCNDITLINQLDGFDLDPRIAVDLDSDIDLADVTDDTFYVEPTAGGDRIGLNRFVWDAYPKILRGHPVQQLEPATEYRLVVTDALDGKARSTTFTTMSIGHEMISMREQLDSGEAYTDAGIAPDGIGLDFVRDDGLRAVFPAATTLAITRYNDVGSGQFETEPVFDSEPAIVGGTYAFGSFLAPSWLNGERIIPRTPSAAGTPTVTGYDEVGFALIVPGGPAPEGGWPVAVFGPGVTRSKYDVFLASDFNAINGMATIAIDPVGHAFGPASDVEVTQAGVPPTVRFSGFGRGSDVDGDGVIGNREGLQADPQTDPNAPIQLRDGLRQTAVDQMSLIRAVAAGSDVDGDGIDDLSATDFRYYGQSLGGIYGTMFAAVEDRIQTAAFTVPGGPISEIARLSPAFRPVVAESLGNRLPSLLNGGDEGFTESLPLFLDPIVLDAADGAHKIQAAFERTDWIDRSGSPEAYAPFLRDQPFPGQSPKNVLYQFALGDQTVPNPASATLMRAGGFEDVTTLYRNDLTPTATTNPHGLLLDPRVSGRQFAQQQFSTFLASNGTDIIDPDGPGPIFEVPIADPDSIEVTNF